MISYTIFVCFIVTSWATLQAYPEEVCCGLYHTGLLENMTNTLSSSRKDISAQCQENSKSIKFLGEEIGKYFKELGEDFGQMLEDLRKGLGKDLNENKMELKGNREELKEVKEEIKELANRNERNFGREIRKVEQAVNKLSVDLGQELKVLGEEIKKGNEEFREERKIQHEAMMMAFNRLLENSASFTTLTENNNRLKPSVGSDVSPQLESVTPSDGIVTEDFSNFTDCAPVYKSGKRSNGVYKVKPAGVQEGFDVYCDMEKDGGGWTVIQRRGNFGTPGDYFYKTWDEYKKGFGKLDEEHWLGNDKISALTRQGPCELRIQMMDYSKISTYANYKVFKVEGEDELYRLNVGNFSGNTRDSLVYHNGSSFSTHDRDNDIDGRNCAATYAGAWWYHSCHYSNLNAKKELNKYYLSWYISKKPYEDLSNGLMKIRPISF